MTATTFTDLLPPSKTCPNRAVKYTPACDGVGVLELTDNRSHTRYALARQPFGGYRLTKAGGVESYVVTVGQCDCAGFTYGKGEPCKHIDAVQCLLANRWLEADDRETVRDVGAEVEEMDAYYAGGEWDGDNGPDRMADDEYADVLGRKLVCEMGGC